jgi:hypothetical protein
MINKQQAIQEIVSLAKTNRINLAEITAALNPQQTETNKKNVLTLTSAFSYLGGIFILSGLCFFAALNWAHLHSFTRILITLGSGIICLILAIIIELKHQRDNTALVLIILSAFLQATGLFVVVAEYFTGISDSRIAALAISTILALLYGCIFYQLKRTSLLFFTIFFAMCAFASAGNLIHMRNNLMEFICGAALIGISYYIQKTAYNSICGFGYSIGSILLLWVGFDLLINSPFEILYLGIACFMLFFSTLVSSQSILVTATIAIFSYISYFTEQHFLNSIGWPIFLILLGLLFFIISKLAFKINSEYVKIPLKVS